jgi:glycosyltransferase involved in cell wall biosynthesis
MLDLTTFLALTRSQTGQVPAALYFHENQISYPWSPADRDIIHDRDKHYGFINYASALAAEAVFFNSSYHRDSFFDELPRLLKHFPDHRELDNIAKVKDISRILPLGLDLKRFDSLKSAENLLEQKKTQPPLILWNHRWEYDKNPKDFFHVMLHLAERDLKFRLVILGENGALL